MKWMLFLLLVILWGLTAFYIGAGSIFIALGLYDWSIRFLPIFMFFSALFAGGSVVATVAWKVETWDS